jgi:PTH2 family peptidyl-tRNA hydrolase
MQSSKSMSLDEFSPNAQAWINGSFAKVCVRCNSEAELIAIHDKAMEMGLEVHLITDSGRTEFHGKPTRTCLAIGPDDAAKIDQVTGHLELL